MSKRTYKLVFGITTGVVSIAEAICSFAIKDPAIQAGVLASIPLVGNTVIAVCKNFVKEPVEAAKA